MANYNLGDWIRLAKPSNTAKFIYVKEAAKVWPHLKHRGMGDYLLRKHHEGCSRYQDAVGQQSREWLASNPTVGAYDAAEEARRINRLYGY